MLDIKDKPVQIFLDELAGKQATPGGGSAAALMGAQAAALVSMVCNLTLGKPKYTTVQEQIQALLADSEALRSELTAMIKADVDVFNKVMASYALPKDTDAEKAVRTAQIQAVLQEATSVPLACVAACVKVIALSRIAAEIGNLGVISDAGVAAIAAYGGLKSAALNVYVNTAALKDRVFAEAKLAELELLMAGAEAEAEAAYQLVKSKL
jgi:formiminotetrahydrofolate cyclodeaminase